MPVPPTLDNHPRSVRRIVTGHSQEGSAIVIEDAQIEPEAYHESTALFTNLFWSDSAPASNDIEFNDLVKEYSNELFLSEGSSFRVFDTPPGWKSNNNEYRLTTDESFHRTFSRGYGILTHDQITLVLDDDKCVTLHPGDVFVQRGTIYDWENNETEWMRMYVVILPCKPVKIGDKELGAEYPGQPILATQKKVTRK